MLQTQLALTYLTENRAHAIMFRLAGKIGAATICMLPPAFKMGVAKAVVCWQKPLPVSGFPDRKGT
jgi:hypothetical protein